MKVERLRGCVFPELRFEGLGSGTGPLGIVQPAKTTVNGYEQDWRKDLGWFTELT